MENKELTVADNDKEFSAILNMLTEYNTGESLTLPTLKFNATEGKWKKTTGEKDEEGKPVYEDIADSITLHIINTARKMAHSKQGAEPYLFTKEYSGNEIVLFNQAKEEVDRGEYQELKEKYSLMFEQVLYAFLDENLYRVKLSGAKLPNFFNYRKSGNPALVYTVCSKGKAQKNGAVKYFDLEFKKGDFVDKQLIIDRVNTVNNLLAKAGADVLTAVPENVKELSIDDAPFGDTTIEEAVEHLG